MKFFYLGISMNPEEVSEVHEQNCPSMPPMIKRTYLGPFNNAKEALRNATEIKNNVTTCTTCCPSALDSVSFFSSLSLNEH